MDGLRYKQRGEYKKIADKIYRNMVGKIIFEIFFVAVILFWLDSFEFFIYIFLFFILLFGISYLKHGIKIKNIVYIFYAIFCLLNLVPIFYLNSKSIYTPRICFAHYAFFAIGFVLFDWIDRRYFNTNFVDLYRNIVVKVGDGIDDLRDGYSERPLSVYSEKLKQKFKIDFENLVKNYVKVLLKNGVLFDYEIKKDSFAIFPKIFFSGLENLKYMLLGSKKNELTSIIFDKEGKIIVFISRSDYERILEPVSYHLLCENLAKVFEKSFLAFFEGDEERVVEILRGG